MSPIGHQGTKVLIRKTLVRSCFLLGSASTQAKWPPALVAGGEAKTEGDQKVLSIPHGLFRIYRARRLRGTGRGMPRAHNAAVFGRIFRRERRGALHLHLSSFVTAICGLVCYGRFCHITRKELPVLSTASTYVCHTKPDPPTRPAFNKKLPVKIQKSGLEDLHSAGRGSTD